MCLSPQFLIDLPSSKDVDIDKLSKLNTQLKSANNLAGKRHGDTGRRQGGAHDGWKLFLKPKRKNIWKRKNICRSIGICQDIFMIRAALFMSCEFWSSHVSKSSAARERRGGRQSLRDEGFFLCNPHHPKSFLLHHRYEWNILLLYCLLSYCSVRAVWSMLAAGKRRSRPGRSFLSRYLAISPINPPPPTKMIRFLSFPPFNK